MVMMLYNINRKAEFPILYQLQCQKQPGGHGTRREEEALRILMCNQRELVLLGTECKQIWRLSGQPQMNLQVFPAPDGSVAQLGLFVQTVPILFVLRG